MSGLAAGIRLSRIGKKTLILERHSLTGGLNSFYRTGGYDLDVGLHAITNYTSPTNKTAPLSRLLRRLRLRLGDLGLCEQLKSQIHFPQERLDFSNDFGLMASQVEAKFPGQAQGFQDLAIEVQRLYDSNFDVPSQSGRKVVSNYISDPLLADMLFCPLMFYGCATEDDMDWAHFALMFMSIYLEGFARPRDGIRPLIKLIGNIYKEAGGDIRMKTGVAKVNVENGKAIGVTLDSGEVIEAHAVISSAGHVETTGICPEAVMGGSTPAAGVMSFTESINILKSNPADRGLEHSIIFYNNRESFRYRRPEAPIDVDSGVICTPGNFRYNEPFDTHMVRITNIADPDFWMNADEDEYKEAKQSWHESSLDAVCKIVPDFRDDIKFTDMFTPRTIKMFTGHINGAVYGAPVKAPDGRTAVKNLYLCGTDTGFLGVVGSMIGGVEIVNIHLLK